MTDNDQPTRSRSAGTYTLVIIAIVAVGMIFFLCTEPSDMEEPDKLVSNAEPTKVSDPAAAAVLNVSTANIRDGVYTNAQARRGDKLYAEHCSLCHLPSMTGKEPAPELAGDLFMSKWTGQSVGDLFIRIATTMPVSNPGLLTEKQYADLVAVLLQANNFPAGAEEIEVDQDYMDGIKIQMN